jgi:hypothetical protein
MSPSSRDLDLPRDPFFLMKVFETSKEWLLQMQLLCIFDNIANVEVWNFWLNKVWINKKLAMCKKKNSLQVGTLIFKFIETKSRKIYEGKH